MVHIYTNNHNDPWNITIAAVFLILELQLKFTAMVLMNLPNGTTHAQLKMETHLDVSRGVCCGCLAIGVSPLLPWRALRLNLAMEILLLSSDPQIKRWWTERPLNFHLITGVRAWHKRPLWVVEFDSPLVGFVSNKREISSVRKWNFA